MLLSKKAYQRIDHEISKFPTNKKRSAVIASLAIAQEEVGWISIEVIRDVARYLELLPIEVQEVATFYNMFNKRPVGKYKISICTGLPCSLQKGNRVATYLKKKLHIEYGETTIDGLFTVVENECMGACGDAPVLILNNKNMCVKMTEDRLDKLLEKLNLEEASSE